MLREDPKESIILHDTITCSDTRYCDYDHAIMLDIFILNNAITVEKSEHSRQYPKVNDRAYYYGNNVQTFEKALLTEILESRGFTIDGYELECRAGKADLLAHKDDLKVIGEVGACRITKIFESFLVPPFVENIDNTELWHMPYPKWKEKTIECVMYIYRRGTNWKELYLSYYSALFG